MIGKEVDTWHARFGDRLTDELSDLSTLPPLPGERDGAAVVDLVRAKNPNPSQVAQLQKLLKVGFQPGWLS